MTDLRPFAEDIWLLEGDTVHLKGIPFPTRSVIIRLNNGEVFVHSPIALTPERIAAVNTLGSVTHLIEPNRIHSLYLEAWRREWPQATAWVSPRFSDHHPEIDADVILENEAPPAWRNQIDQIVIEGHSVLDEVWFCHRASGSLIVTDLIQKHDPAGNDFVRRLLKRAAGLLGEKGGTAIDIRLSFKDRKLARFCLEEVLDWEFERLILSHGLCLTACAKAEVRRAMSWLL